MLRGTITDHRDGVATGYRPGMGWLEDRNTVHVPEPDLRERSFSTDSLS